MRHAYWKMIDLGFLYDDFAWNPMCFRWGLGTYFCKKISYIYIYIYRLLHNVYMSQMDKFIFYEFYVSLNVYLQYTMFDLTSWMGNMPI